MSDINKSNAPLEEVIALTPTAREYLLQYGVNAKVPKSTLSRWESGADDTKALPQMFAKICEDYEYRIATEFVKASTVKIISDLADSKIIELQRLAAELDRAKNNAMALDAELCTLRNKVQRLSVALYDLMTHAKTKLFMSRAFIKNVARQAIGADSV